MVLHPTVDHSILEPAGVEGTADRGAGLALELARRGMVAFCPRAISSGATTAHSSSPSSCRYSAGGIPASKGMAKMLFDARMAVDILAGLPVVDPARLGAVGHSLGQGGALPGGV